MSIQCPVCEMDYSETLAKCPYCGANSPSPQNVIRVYRDRESLLSGGCIPILYVDGRDYGKVRDGSTIDISVIPGKHTIILETKTSSMLHPIVRNSYDVIVKKSVRILKCKVRPKMRLNYVEGILDSVIELSRNN